MSTGVGDKLPDILFAGCVATLVVFAIRKALYSFLQRAATKLGLETNKDKFMFGLWCLVIHSLGLFAQLTYLISRGELSGLFWPSAHEDSSLWIPSHTELVVTNAQLWVISLEIGFYMVEFIYLALDPPPDIVEKVVHHVTALILIVVSLVAGHQQLGIYVILLHKVIEPFLFGAKAAHYAGSEMFSTLLFSLFILIWLPTRLYVFPHWIYKVLWAPGCDFTDTAWYISATFLAALMGLHIYWTGLIFRVIQTMLVVGNMKLNSELDPGYKKD